jgi:hypothetical protein
MGCVIKSRNSGSGHDVRNRQRNFRTLRGPRDLSRWEMDDFQREPPGSFHCSSNQTRARVPLYDPPSFGNDVVRRGNRQSSGYQVKQPERCNLCTIYRTESADLTAVKANSTLSHLTW